MGGLKRSGKRERESRRRIWWLQGRVRRGQGAQRRTRKGECAPGRVVQAVGEPLKEAECIVVCAEAL